MIQKLRAAEIHGGLIDSVNHIGNKVNEIIDHINTHTSTDEDLIDTIALLRAALFAVVTDLLYERGDESYDNLEVVEEIVNDYIEGEK